MIFFGTERIEWTEYSQTDYAMPKYQPLIKQLAKRPNSILAKDAQHFLDFIALSANERDQKYPITHTTDNGLKIDDWTQVRMQLHDALSIPSPWDSMYSRNCLSGLFCTQYE